MSSVFGHALIRGGGNLSIMIYPIDHGQVTGRPKSFLVGSWTGGAVEVAFTGIVQPASFFSCRLLQGLFKDGVISVLGPFSLSPK